MRPGRSAGAALIALALLGLSRGASGASSPSPPTNIRVTHDAFTAHAEPALAVNPHDPRNLLGAAQYLMSTRETARPATFVSFDGGQSWRDTGPLPMPDGYVSSDDVSVAFTGAGIGLVAAEVYGSAGGSAIAVWRTTDEGRSFAAPLVVYRGASRTKNTDHPSIAAAPGSRPDLYLAWSYGSRLLFSRSVDGGHSFSTAQSIGSPSDAHPDLAVTSAGPSGAAYVVYDRGNSAPFAVVSSTDFGTHFGAPNSPIAVHGVTTQRAQISTLLGAATNPRTGVVFVARAVPLGASGHLQILVWRSGDAGRTWSAPEPVTSGESDHFQPQLAVVSGGEVDVSYFVLMRGRVRELLVRSSGESSSFRRHRTIGGRAFSPGTGVQGKGSTGGKGGSGGWIGDYQALAAGSDAVYPLWNDGRSGHLELYTAIIALPGTTSPSALR